MKDHSSHTAEDIQAGGSSRQLVILFSSGLILITAALYLAFDVQSQAKKFQEAHKLLSVSLVDGAANNIVQYLTYNWVQVDQMGSDYPSRFSNIAMSNAPKQDSLDNDFLETLITRRLPGHYSYAVISDEGFPYVRKGEIPLEPGCHLGVKQYLETGQIPDLSIHGESENSFHFDLMTTTSEGILFFVSMPLARISEMLRNAQTPHISLLLLSKGSARQVEASSLGVRTSQWFGSALTDDAVKSVLYSVDIAQTDWRLVALEEPGYTRLYVTDLWSRTFLWYGLFSILVLFLTWRLYLEAGRRMKTQIKLLAANEGLERKVEQRTQSLRESQAHYQAIIETADVAMISISEKGVISRFNPAAERIFGYKADEVLGENISILMTSEHKDQHDAYINRYVQTGENRVIGQGSSDVPGRRKDGREILLRLTIADTGIHGAQRFSGVLRDITAEYEAEEALFREKELAQTTLNALTDGVIATDAGGLVTDINPAAEALIGYPKEEALGKNIQDIFQVQSESTYRKLVDHATRCLRQKSLFPTQRQTALLISRSGKSFGIESSAVALRGKSGEITGAVLTFRDVTEARDLQRKLEFDARHDALTGLVNRREFEERIERAIQYCKDRYGNCDKTLMFMDLDQFKVVNDTAGHAAGDELLRQISRLLQSKTRERDTLARIGGDEFALLLESCTLDHAVGIANGIIQAVMEFQFLWDGKIFPVGISLGLVGVSSEDITMDEVLSQADAACYTAKQQGRNRYHIFTQDNEILIQRKGEMWWTTEIVRAAEEDRLVLYRQRIISIKPSSGETGHHYEILIRMLDEDGNLIPPSDFLPAAERYKLMPMIDRWVIRTMFSWLKEHPRHLQELSQCSINLSGQSLGDTTFHEFLAEALVEYEIPTQKICWEITETAAISNFNQAQYFIDLMRTLGCSFSLDDFGAGLSSFGYLKNLKVDYLKIDGSFVRDMVNDPKDCLIVESIHSVGMGMQMKTIAEFVEDQATLELLKEIGIDFAQGYGVQKPVPLAE